MRQTVREGRAVVEDELVVAVLARLTVLDRRTERVVLGPVRQHAALERGQVGAGGDLVALTVRGGVVGAVQRVGHGSVAPS
ncbi:hypothetical protein D3C74_316050 [compost metagenome]